MTSRVSCPSGTHTTRTVIPVSLNQPLAAFLPSGPGDGAHGLEHISKHLVTELLLSPRLFIFKGVVELRLTDRPS